MISLTSQERKVLIFLCVLLSVCLFWAHGRKAFGCNRSAVEVYADTQAPRVVDLNRATMAELVAVPGIGEKTAQEILRVRSLKGRFSSVEELKLLKGIGDKKVAGFKKYLFVR
jgi:competence ComEA-like helix-hairpin-helix protein